MAWCFSGGMVLVAILYLMALNVIPWWQRHTLKKLIKKTAGQTHAAFLFQEGVYDDFAKKKWNWFVLLTVYLIVMLLSFDEYVATHDMDIASPLHSFIGATIILTFVAHVLAGGVSFIWILMATSEKKGDWLELTDFFRGEEMDVLRSVQKVMGENGNYKNPVNDLEDNRFHRSFNTWKVYSPDLLVPVLKQRPLLEQYVNLQKQMNEIKEMQTAHLTSEQLERNEAFEQAFRESLQQLEAFIHQIDQATDFARYEAMQGGNLAKKRIRREFDRKQAEAEQALKQLNRYVQASAEKAKPSVPEAMEELQQIIQSTTVSPALKEEAAELLQRISEQMATAASGNPEESM